MKATTAILVVAAMAMGVAAQSPAATSPSAAPAAPTPPATTPAAPSPEIAKLVECIKSSCDVKDVNCIAKKCTNTAAPTRDQAEATNKCYTACDDKKSKVDEYKTCTADCIATHYLAGSPGAQNNPSVTGKTNGTTTGNGNNSNDKNGTSSSTATHGSSSATYSTVLAAVALFTTFFAL